LDFGDGAAIALVAEDVFFDAEAHGLGTVLVSEPQPDSTTARAAATAAAPVIAVRFIVNSILSELP